MIKSGFIPARPLNIDYSSIVEFKRDGKLWKSVSGQSSVVKTFFSDILRAGFETPLNTAFMGSRNMKYSGKPTPQPSPVIKTWPKITANNKPYKRRSSDGSIVVSPYQVGYTRFTFSNGGQLFNIWPRPKADAQVSVAYYQHGRGSWEVIPGEYGDFPALRISDSVAVTGILLWDEIEASISDDRTVFDNGFIIPDDGLFKNIPFSVNSQLVVDNTAAANTASVDVLTALAEAPETFKYVIGICTSVVKLFNGFKKREFRLRDKVKRVRLTYDQQQSAISKQISSIDSLSISEARKRRLKKEYVRKQKQLRLQFKKDTNDLLSAIADLWLQFRYAIMPNVYLIEGALDALEKRNSLYQRWSKTQFEPFTIEGWSGDVGITNRAFIKRKFVSNSIWNNLSANLFLTAYELIPLSFVLDWFINVGNSLSALLTSSISSGIEQEGSTYSWKVDGSFTLRYDDGSQVRAELKGYKRSLIDTQSYCGLQFNPQLSPERLYDAVALTWQLALKRLLK